MLKIYKLKCYKRFYSDCSKCICTLNKQTVIHKFYVPIIIDSHDRLNYERFNKHLCNNAMQLDFGESVVPLLKT